MLEVNRIYNMDCIEGLKQLDDKSIHCCVTSPPYWGLRDYKIQLTKWPEISYSPLAGMMQITIPAYECCLGLEPTIEMFVAHIVYIFREVRRVLRDDGTLWLNFGDSYADGGRGGHGKTDKFHGHNGRRDLTGAKKVPVGLKHKDLCGIPWRIAFALQADEWYLRFDIIWAKPSCMPESTKDRPTKSHEYIFLMSKSQRYYYDYEAIKEPCLTDDLRHPNGSKGVLGHENAGRRSGNKERKFGNDRDRPDSHLGASIPWEGNTRNKRGVWTVATQPFSEAHFATFPPKLIEPCILAGCPAGGIVLDPFMGSGTTGMVSTQLQRNYIGFELNSDYIKIAENNRLNNVQIRIV